MCRVISFSMSRVDSKLGPLFFKDNTTSTKSELSPAEAQAKIRSKKTSTTKGIQLLSLIIYTTVIPLAYLQAAGELKANTRNLKTFPAFMKYCLCEQSMRTSDLLLCTALC